MPFIIRAVFKKYDTKLYKYILVVLNHGLRQRSLRAATQMTNLK